MFKDPQYVIFRDDDLGVIGPTETERSLLNKFKRGHEKYNHYGIIHEVAYVTETPNRVPDINKYVKSQNNIKIQLHAHRHCDFTTLGESELHEQFSTGVKIIQDIFGYSPTIWYPPYNKWNPMIEKIAAGYGLKMVPKVISLNEFIKSPMNYFNPSNPFSLCYHYWSPNQCNLLNSAMDAYLACLSTHYSNISSYWSEKKSSVLQNSQNAKLCSDSNGFTIPAKL